MDLAGASGPAGINSIHTHTHAYNCMEAGTHTRTESPAVWEQREQRWDEPPMDIFTCGFLHYEHTHACLPLTQLAYSVTGSELDQNRAKPPADIHAHV